MFYPSISIINFSLGYKNEKTYLTIAFANVRRASLLLVAACLRISVERR